MRTDFYAILLWCAFIAAFSAAANAATLTVTKTADTGDGVCSADCSLREAIAAAASGDTVEFDAPLFDAPQVIRINSQLLIDKNLIVTGRAANLLTIRNVAANSRVFQINSGFTVELSGMTISGGNAGGSGGGIFNNGALTLRFVHVTGNTASSVGGGISNNNPAGTLNVINSTVSNNTANGSAESGGGIDNIGTLNVINSTISGNRAPSGDFSGGGIWSASTQGATIINSTIVDNEAAGANSAGGVFRDDGRIFVRNTIIAGNRNNSTLPDVMNSAGAGSFVSQSYNIIGNRGTVTAFANGMNNDQVGAGGAGNQVNPLVFPLGNYGGGVPTHALRRFPAASPAIDNGATATGVTADARGAARAFDEAGVAPTTTGGNNSDIGAFEHLPYVNDNAGNALANGGAGSLRDTFAAVPADTFVIFDPDFFGNSFFERGGIARVIGLIGGQIILDKSIRIVGTTANALIVQNTAAASSTSRVFEINSGTVNRIAVELSAMTVTGGNVTGDDVRIRGGGILNVLETLTLRFVHVTGNTVSVFGGGIFNGGGTLNVINSTVSNNTANNTNTGGGIANSGGTLTVTNSTISGNRVPSGDFSGGGIFSNNGGSAIISNSTITDNEAAGANSASGVYKFNSGTVTVRNTIIAGNRNNSTLPDVNTNSGAFTSQGYNLIGNRGTATNFNQIGDQAGGGGQPIIDPRLAPLADNGGATQTHAPVSGSPVIDKGNSFGASLDQRSLPRPFDNSAVANAAGGDAADIGAVELQSQSPTAASVTVGGRVTIGERGLRNARVTLTNAAGETRAAMTSAFGYYRFGEVKAGQTYIVAVVSKRFTLAPQVVAVNEDIADLNFVEQ